MLAANTPDVLYYILGTVEASSLDSFKERFQIDVQKLGVTGHSV